MGTSHYVLDVGDRCRSVKPIRVFNHVIPAGTAFTVRKKYWGYELESDPCGRCGVTLIAHRVPTTSVEPVT